MSTTNSPTTISSRDRSDGREDDENVADNESRTSDGNQAAGLSSSPNNATSQVTGALASEQSVRALRAILQEKWVDGKTLGEHHGIEGTCVRSYEYCRNNDQSLGQPEIY
jgi:hypothetical protein